MFRRISLASLVVLVALVVMPAGTGTASAAPGECTETPDPDRWTSAGDPDQGSTPVISAHRGASRLAPENTIWAYRHAFAYGAEMVEVDVRETADGRYISMHDDSVDRTTNGEGPVSGFTLEEIRALNAADYEPWAGGEYDPSVAPTVEEVAALAARAGGGIEFDIKDVSDPSKLAQIAERYGILERSAFNSQDPRIQAAYPEARLIYNRDTFEPPGFLYALGSSAYTYFGSRLDEYTPESIAEIHDACGLVTPHAYDGTYGDEAESLLYARSIGADGAQVNSPDVAADALDEPVPTTLTLGPLDADAVTDLTGETRVDLSYNQGIARFDGGWIASNTYGLVKVNDALVPIDANEFTAIPQELQDQGYNHVGDTDVDAGFIYAPLEQDDYSRGIQRVARYDLATLDFVDSVEIAGHHAAWVAVQDGILWSMDEFTGDVITRFRIDTWEQLPSLKLSQVVDRVQGGDLGHGALWLSTDDDRNGLYRVDLATGRTTFVGTMGHIEGEGEGIDVTPTDSGLLHTVTTDFSVGGVWFADFNATIEPPAEEDARLCLLNATNGLGLPHKTVEVERGSAEAHLPPHPIVTGRNGCTDLPPGLEGNPRARFLGGGEAQPSEL
jgi:glycerophosphoryl diester phosphodiesterase